MVWWLDGCGAGRYAHGAVLAGIGVRVSNEVDIRIKFEQGQPIPVEYAAPFTLKMTSGMDPYMFSISMSPEFAEKLPSPRSLSEKDGAACKFSFTTPKASGGGSVSWDWGGWYLVRIEPAKSESGLFVATFGDERWRLTHDRFTREYNIEWPDGTFRVGSTPDGFGGRTSAPWRSVEAIEDFLEFAGYEPSIRVSKEKDDITLPFNLGNSPSGGYVDATAEQILNPMLESIDARIFWVDGQPHVVDRTGDEQGLLSRLRSLPRIVDSVGKGQNGWERPRKILYSFEIKLEAALENSDLVLGVPGVTNSDLQRGRAILDFPENVMPRSDATLRSGDQWWDDQGKPVRDTDWTPIAQEVGSNCPNVTASNLADPDKAPSDFVLDLGTGGTQTGLTVDHVIGENWFLPLLFPHKRGGVGRDDREISEGARPTENARLALLKRWFDAVVRATWHRIYRVQFPKVREGVEYAYRSLTEMEFGRLTPAGETISRGAVWCDWSEQSKYALELDRSDPFNAEFSDNHPFDPKRAAPFTARWVEQQGSELLFELKPNEANRLGQVEIYPGLFDEALNYGSWFQAINDEYLQAQELRGKLEPLFRFRTILSGRLAASVEIDGMESPVGEIKDGRRLEVELELFPEGGIESLHLKESNMTANFGYSAEQLDQTTSIMSKWPEVLLNESDVDKRAKDVRDMMRERYSLGDAGGFLFPGVQPFSDGIYIGGDVYEASVVVGDPDPWSITSQYIVMPGIPGPRLSRKDRDGVAPRLIAQ